MFSLKRFAAKRALKKNMRDIKTSIRRTYKDISRDLTRKTSGFKIPLKVTISR